MYEDDNYLKYLVVSDEVRFHFKGYMRKHRCHVHGSESPHVVIGMKMCVSK
jgi:hypothetical protein